MVQAAQSPASAGRGAGEGLCAGVQERGRVRGVQQKGSCRDHSRDECMLPRDRTKGRDIVGVDDT